ncbi:MAG: hypothetical protein P9L90_03100 [Candidatus Aadella gelida]|nr:hypothetical protein [Candidatus Aadella gelida]
MEMDLKGIIEKIKEEGVSEADKKAEEIISGAETKAKSIIKETEEKKDKILKKAAEEADKLRKNADESVKQASRDAMLALKASLIGLFDTVIKEEVSKELNPDILKETIVNFVDKFGDSEHTSLEILLNEKDKKSLEKTLFARFKDRMKTEVTLKVSPSVEKGFRIGEKGSNSYYDVTDDAVAEAFKAFLNPKISKIIDKNG